VVSVQWGSECGTCQSASAGGRGGRCGSSIVGVCVVVVNLVQVCVVLPGRTRTCCDRSACHRRNSRDGRDEDQVAEEKLQIDVVCGRVLWVLEPERAENWRPIDAGLMEGGVEVVEQAIPNIESILRSLGH